MAFLARVVGWVCGSFVLVYSLDSSRVRVPFGIAQQGRAFRNEITPGNFVFRLREFELMELEYFVKPDEDDQESVRNA